MFTYAYMQEFVSAFLDLLYRVLIGESIGEYLALSHFGETFQIDHSISKLSMKIMVSIQSLLVN